MAVPRYTPRGRKQSATASNSPEPPPAVHGTSAVSVNSSLLSRLSPRKSSLLSRLVSESEPPVRPNKGVRLVDRLSSSPARNVVELDEGEIIPTGAGGYAGREGSTSVTEEGQLIERGFPQMHRQSSRPLSLQVRLQTRPEDLRARLGIDTSIEQAPSPSEACLEEGEMNDDVQQPERTSSPASEAAVDRLLASVLDLSDITDATASSAVSERADPRPTHSPRSNASPSTVIEECRRLLLPQLIQNAWMRESHLGADGDAIAQRAEDLLTEERCKEFMALAQEVRAQMQQREQLEQEAERGGPSTGTKRPRDVDVQGKEGPERGAKLRRVSTPHSDVSHALGATREPAPQSRLGLIHDSDSIPKAPRAMLVDSSVRAVEEYLARMQVSTVSSDLSQSASSRVTPTPPSLTTMAPTLGTARVRDVQVQNGDTAAVMDTVNDDVPTQFASLPDLPRNTPPKSDDNDGDMPEREESQSTAKPVSQPPPPAVHEPPPSDIQMESSQTESQNPPAGPQDLPHHHLNSVPSLWSVNVGTKGPSMFEFDINIDEEVAGAAERWACRYQEFSLNDAHISVHLLCLPAEVVATANRKLDPAASPRDVAQMLWDIPTAWPQPGTLIVEMNESHPRGAHVWFSEDMGPTNGPLDLTACLHAGRNTVRLLQLGDMSDRLFVVHAAFPSSEERDRAAKRCAGNRDWADFFAKASTRLRPSSTPTVPVPGIAW